MDWTCMPGSIGFRGGRSSARNPDLDYNCSTRCLMYKPAPPPQEPWALRWDKSDVTTVAAAEVGAKFAGGVKMGPAR